ncbi:MAG: hypothetical protein IIW10_01225 [Spirochaetaceae bacterium]|nr:hypothetical protein [Spirochaetaceae bacterium]
MSESDRVSLNEQMASWQKELTQLNSREKAAELWANMAVTQEQIGEFSNATKSYAEAAILSPSRTSTKYELGRARCALFAGDTVNSKAILKELLLSEEDRMNDRIRAEGKLLTVWCDIAEAKNYSAQSKNIALLRSYSTNETMESVRPAVLFSLWWLTDDKNVKETLLKNYPNSPEAALVDGKAALMPSALWFLSEREKVQTVATPTEEAATVAKKTDEPKTESKNEEKAETDFDTDIKAPAIADVQPPMETPEVANVQNKHSGEPADKSEKAETVDTPAPKVSEPEAPKMDVAETPTPPKKESAEMPGMEPAGPPPKVNQPDNRIFSTVPVDPRPPVNDGSVPIKPATPPKPSVPKESVSEKRPASDFPILPSTRKSGKPMRYQQVGLFRDMENAERMALDLKASGFAPVIIEKVRGENELFFAVAVPDPNNVTSELLRAKGYDSFAITY